MKDTINKIKSELLIRYNVAVDCSELQGGCVGIKHAESDTIKVRFVLKQLGLTRLTQVEYRDTFKRIVNHNTIAY